MNRQHDIDDVVERWLDDGPEAAPERFVWAALEQVDRTPQRGAWRVALESMPMYTKIALPVLGVAAVLLVAVLASGAFRAPSEVGGSPSPSAEPTPAVTPAPSPAACGVTPASGGGLHIVWCVTGDEAMTVDFTFDAPTEWADQTYAGTQALYLVRPDGRRIAISRNGPDTIDAWRDELVATQEFDLTEPEPITIDGIDGYVFDVSVADGVDSADAPPVIEDSELDFTITEGGAARVWLVAHPEHPIAIVTGAPGDEFEAWAGEVADAVDTIQWAP